MSSKPHTLNAVYAGGGDSKTLTYTLNGPADEAAATDTAARTAYLHSLRASVAQLQAEVNELLTRKMDEDKRRDAAGDDERARREEENYGEEVVGEEDG